MGHMSGKTCCSLLSDRWSISLFKTEGLELPQISIESFIGQLLFHPLFACDSTAVLGCKYSLSLFVCRFLLYMSKIEHLQRLLSRGLMYVINVCLSARACSFACLFIYVPCRLFPCFTRHSSHTDVWCFLCYYVVHVWLRLRWLWMFYWRPLATLHVLQDCMI